MNNILKNIINYIKQSNIYSIIIFIIILLILYYIIILLINDINKIDEINKLDEINKMDETNKMDEPLYITSLDKENNKSEKLYDNINIRSTNRLYTKKDKHRDVILDLYSDMYEDINYYNISS